MKITIQVSTPNLGDIAIEETEDKNTTNKPEQQAIIVELLFSVIRKVQAVYEIPTSMLDLGEYTSAEERFHEDQKAPKPSSAERNREEASTLAPEFEEQEQEHFISEEELDIIAAFRAVKKVREND